MKNNTALLVMDMQQGILKNYPAAVELLAQTRKAIEGARSKSIPVIFVKVTFREGMPEIAEQSKFFSAMKQRLAGAHLEAFATIAPELDPRENDIIIQKRRISAFTGSDLEVVLRSLGIQHIILAGISTSGVVLSTTREASDKDFIITILSECCGDADAEVHRILMEKIFPRQADIMPVADWLN